jgi:hypothetical protein
MKKILLILTVAFINICMMAQNADLRLNLEKNKIYRLKAVSNQNVSQTINGVEQNTTTSSNSIFSIKMMEATADLIIAEIRFDSITNITNTMGKTVKINSSAEGNMSSEEASDVMSCVMNRLTKNALYIKMDKTGKVVDIVNLAMLRDIILKDTSAIIAKLAPILKPQIKNTVSLDALKTMINTFTYNLPAKQIKVGEQWDINLPVNSGGLSLEIKTNYKLGSIKDNIASVTSESAVKAADNAAPLEYSGAKITYDGIKGIGKSDMTINILTGLTIETTAKMTMSGDLNLNAPGMSMQIPMKITSESSIKSL